MCSSDSYLLSEETLELRNCVISDKLVYLTQFIDRDLEGTRSIGLVDWFTENHIRDIYLEFNLALFGERNSYLHCVVDFIVPSSGITNSIDTQGKINVSNSDDLMLVDIAKFVDLPKGMTLKGRPARIRLERLDNLDCLRKYASNLFLEDCILRAGTFGFDRDDVLLNADDVPRMLNVVVS